jgi:hypothetical protein
MHPRMQTTFSRACVIIMEMENYLFSIVMIPTKDNTENNGKKTTKNVINQHFLPIGRIFGEQIGLLSKKNKRCLSEKIRAM